MIQFLKDHPEVLAALVVLVQALALWVHKTASGSAADKVLGTVARFLPGDMRGMAPKPEVKP